MYVYIYNIYLFTQLSYSIAHACVYTSSLLFAIQLVHRVHKTSTAS